MPEPYPHRCQGKPQTSTFRRQSGSRSKAATYKASWAVLHCAVVSHHLNVLWSYSIIIIIIIIVSITTITIMYRQHYFQCYYYSGCKICYVTTTIGTEIKGIANQPTVSNKIGYPETTKDKCKSYNQHVCNKRPLGQICGCELSHQGGMVVRKPMSFKIQWGVS